jgi:hypothetical protein
LRSVLLPAASDGASAAFQDAEDDLMQLSIEARVQRRGRSVRLVVSPLEASATALPENRALIALLAQGHRWLEQWLRGEVSSLRAIAKSAGKSERHVSQVIRAAFLTPDLVEAVLHGRQPAQLTLREVMKQLPWDWTYIPHIGDAIWREFPRLVWRPIRLVRDAEQVEQLTLQLGELRVEDLDGAGVAHEHVPLGEAE